MDKNCPHLGDMEYTDEVKNDGKGAQRYPFKEPKKLQVRSDSGGAIRRRLVPPRLTEIFDGADDGETMPYPAAGKCEKDPKDVILVTRNCIEKFCSGNHKKCPRFLKTTN